MIRVVHPGSRIRMLTFYPSRIPDPGVKKAPDPGFGSGYATLATNILKWKVELKLQLLVQVNSLFKNAFLFCVVEQVYKAP
jgi:hypothetical protein